MCELGAYTMDLALTAGGEADHLPVGEVALSILARPEPSTSLNVTDSLHFRSVSRSKSDLGVDL